MIAKEIIFNPRYSGKWQETPFLPFPSLRNIKMALNFLVARIQCKLSMVRLLNYPHFALIDPSSVCNLHCPLCPTGQGDTSRPRCFLKFEDYKKIVDEIGDYLTSVLFTNWGEPLLNKEFFKMAKYTKKVKHVPFTSVATNLNVTLLDKDLEALILSGLDLICISIDGASQKTYEKYRQGGSLEKVVGNTKAILEKRKELDKNNPFVIWQFFVFNHNKHEIGKIEKMARKIGVDALRICAPHVYLGIMDKSLTELYKISKKHLTPLGTEYSAYNKDGKKKEEVEKCNWLWKGVSIGPDGSIFPCCNIFPQRHCFGNVLNERFKEIWNNEKYQTARKAVNGKKDFFKVYQMPKCSKENICIPCIAYENWI